MLFSFQLHVPSTQALPEFLKERKYQDITSNKDLPFQKAFKTDLAPFEWMASQPGHAKALGFAMQLQRGSSWIDTFPIEEALGEFPTSPDMVLFVDVGGGFGQQAGAFKEKFSALAGRVVVQDIPVTLSSAKPIDGIEFVAHDFFLPQPVKGAKIYYLRRILHDWTDDDCVKILKNIVPAMDPYSRLIVDEVVMPDIGVSWQTAYMDLTMMSCLGGMERTRAEYAELLNKAGLVIDQVHKYDFKDTSVIVTALM
jgi:demethylsterigmatocystin 6-O-methyltransferase